MFRWILILMLALAGNNAFALQVIWSYTPFYVHEPGKTPQVYAEVYWNIDPSTLAYTLTEKGTWVGKVQTDIVLRSDTGIVTHDRYVLQTVPAQTQHVAAMQNIMDLHRYIVPYGEVQIEVHLTDMADTTNKTSFKGNIRTVKPEKSVFYSGIQFIDTNFENSQQTMFLKNNVQQIPLSVPFLDDNRGRLNYYTEFYNDGSLKGPLVHKAYISKKENDGAAVYRILETDTILNAQPVVPLLGKVDITTLPSGNYYLSVQMEDTNGVKLAEKAVFFQRSNQNPVSLEEVSAPGSDSLGGGMERVELFDLSKTFVNKYSLAQVMAIVKMLLPISQPLEAQTINGFIQRPDEMYMRYFVYNFWLGRNKLNPEKSWEDYAEKVKYVNREFSAPGKPGYETDRGFIYLKYGRPDERVEARSESGALPYEVWQYNALEKQMGALFLFYQGPSMINDYELLHSNVNGEKRNPIWRNMLYLNAETAKNQNHRVEQYFPAGK